MPRPVVVRRNGPESMAGELEDGTISSFPASKRPYVGRL